MEIALVDIQGFMVDGEFIPKEMTIRIGKKTSHFLFKPSVEFSSLSREDKKMANHVERNVHGLKYSSGYVDLNELDQILRDNLQQTNIIYVRGHQKIQFLQRKCAELEMTNHIVNLEDFDNSWWQPITFQQSIPPCMNHFHGGRFQCSLHNVDTLYNWLCNLLPK